MKHFQRGFSLVELLAVIVVMALLAGIASAGWQRAVAAGKATTCLNNLRVVGVASAQYGVDNDNRLPATAHQRSSWIGTLQPYLGTRKPYRCPCDKNPRRVTSYAINDGLSSASGSRRVNVSRPAETMFMAETNDNFEGSDHFHLIDEETGEFLGAGAAEQFAVPRHPNGTHFLFIDGHVEALTDHELAARLAAPDSAFINPNP